MTKFTKEFLQREYWDLGKSPAQIATENDSYPNAVRRALKEHWDKLRSRSEAQVNALARGRQAHPTKGRPRSSETKAKIGNSVRRQHSRPSKKARERRQSVARRRWKNIPVASRVKFVAAGFEAARRTAQHGSKAELFLLDALRASGYEVQHRDGCDIKIPGRKIAIFVDGRPAFEPVWGEEQFARIQESLQHRRVKALAEGLHVIRVCVRKAKPSTAYLRTLLTVLFSTIESVVTDSVPAEHEVNG